MDFVTRVKEALPDVSHLHAHLDSGSIWVGNDLREIRNQGLPIEDVLRDVGSDEYVHLKRETRAALSKRRVVQALLEEWRTLLRPQEV
jgi:hypothetical protein